MPLKYRHPHHLSMVSEFCLMQTKLDAFKLKMQNKVLQFKNK